jgi:Mn-dependent DtxR family transcriptional regulator
MKDIARRAGITERAASQIVSDLERDGYLTKTRDGRRNRYELDGRRIARASELKSATVAELLAMVLEIVEKQPLA